MNPRNWKKILLSVASGLFVPASIYAANVALPHNFSPGTPIRAEEVNANFTALRDAVNTKADASQTGMASGQRLKLLGFTSADGLKLLSKYYTGTEDLLYDAALSIYCAPRTVRTSATTTEILCLPASYSSAVRAFDSTNRYLFSDSTCTTRFYEAQERERPAGLPTAQRFINEDDSSGNRRVYRLGQRVTGSMTVYGNTNFAGGSAGCVNLNSMTVDFYLRGDEVSVAEMARLNPATF